MKRFGTSKSSAVSGFSLVELLVVIGIIGILVSILIPTVSRVRRAAQTASTQALMVKLQSAIEQYRNDYSAYPGPLPNESIGPQETSASAFELNVRAATGYYIPAGNKIVQDVAPNIPAIGVNNTLAGSITGTNNLVLGLFGGLFYDASATPRVKYDPSLVGKGPSSLNPSSLKSGSVYLEDADLSWNTQNGLKTGRFAPEGITYNPANPTSVRSLLAADSIIPSIVDRYTDKMPLLYLRARSGASAVAGYGAGGVYPPTRTVSPKVYAQYDLAHVIGYTESLIGRPGNLKAALRAPYTEATEVGHGLRRIYSTENTNILASVDAASRVTPTTPAKGTPPVWLVYPYDFEAYLTALGTSTVSATSNNHYYQSTPRVKDSYILISAGPDRIYGTNDDITSFGQVAP